MSSIPFQHIDWSNIPVVIYPGETGIATWQTLFFGGIRVRIVQYSPDYVADHWCQKGHIVHCLKGEFISELSNGEKFVLTAGDTYIVSDDMSSHRSVTSTGATLLIVDGEFLQ
ncbi:MAG: DHCW motif cupin fold protein [Sediminibacterium sp.]